MAYSGKDSPYMTSYNPKVSSDDKGSISVSKNADGAEQPTHEEQEYVIELIKRFNKMEVMRKNYEKVWDDITEYVMPSQGAYVLKNVPVNGIAIDPERLSRRRLDSTATVSARSLMAKVTAEMTGTSIRWFDYRDEDPIIDRRDDVRRCLMALSDRTYNILNSGNFRTAHIEATMEWIAYGTACMENIEQEETGRLVFRCIPLREIYFTIDKFGDIDVINRKMRLNYRQLCQFFGEDALPEEMHTDCEEDPFKEFMVLHVIEQNPMYDPNKQRNIFYKFKSCYILLDKHRILQEGYFRRRPYTIFRFWTRPGEAYGGSPIIDCLADIRMLNVLEAASLRLIQRKAEPPLIMEDDSVVLPVKVTPSGLNIGGMRDGKPTIGPLFTNPGDETALEQKMEQKRQVIRSSLFVDPMMNREQSIRTASEVNKRSNEEMIGITPFLGRYEVEYLNPILHFVLDVVLHTSKDIPIPPIMHARVPKIIFSAPLAKTQRGQELQNSIQFMQMVQNMAQVDPQILMHMNWDGVLSNLVDLLSVPMEMLKDPRAVAQAVAQQAAQQQMQQKMAMQQHAAQMGSSLVNTAAAGVGAAANAQGAVTNSIKSSIGALSGMAKAGLVGRQDVGLPPLDPSAGYTPQGGGGQ